MQWDIQVVKLEIYVREEFIETLRDALANIGVCEIGDYSHVVSYQETKGIGNHFKTARLIRVKKVRSVLELKQKWKCDVPFI